MSSLGQLTMESFALDQASLVNFFAPKTSVDSAALFIAGLASLTVALRKYTWDKPSPYDHIWYERPQERDGAQPYQQKSRNIAHLLEELNKRVVIFWGSQSGTAESFANRLGRELHQRFHLETLVADLSDFDPETIASIPESKFAVFILSTYGDGDPSDNASPFLEYLSKLQGDQALSSLRYAIFGLGNSHYRFYNRIVDVVEATLGASGAQRMYEVGKADDALGTTQESFAIWKDDFQKLLRDHLGLEEHEIKFEPSFSVVADASLEPIDLHLGVPVPEKDSGKTGSNSPVRALRITQARELFSSPGRSCIHLELDLDTNANMTYKTGDHLGVWPTNPAQEVEALISFLGAGNTRHVPLHIATLSREIKAKVPTPTTLDALLRHYLEICAPVPRDTVSALAEFAPSQGARDFLTIVGRDKDAYARLQSTNYITLPRLLELAVQADETSTTWSIPVPFLIESLPRARPRYYSISSSSIVSSRSPTITVGIEDALLSSTDVVVGAVPATIPGLATNYLHTSASSISGFVSTRDSQSLSYKTCEELLPSGSIFAHIRRSKFKLPALSSCPLVLVAAGTGLAPLKAFIEERLRLQSIGKPIGQMLLFFGCRRPDEDFIYRSELEHMQRELGDKLKIVTAFSREDGTPKMYAQDRVKESAVDVCEMLSAGASLYVCGRASMAREVGEVVRGAVGKLWEWDENQINEWSERLKRTRKWQEDVWG